MKKCTFCAEEIQDEAIKCKHCGSMLDGSGLDLSIKIDKINPFAEYQTEIRKNPGRISIIGWVGIFLGMLCFVMGLWSASSPQSSNPPGQEIPGLIISGFGIFLVFGCYMWARRKPK